MTEKKDDRRGSGPVDELANDLLDTIRSWLAGIGLLAGGGAGIAVFVTARAGTVPGVIALVLGVGAIVAAVFGVLDDDFGAWAGAFVALVTGVGAFVTFLVALTA